MYPMCDVGILDFTAFILGLDILYLHIYNGHYLLCTPNTTYHREYTLYGDVCLNVMLIISQMLAQLLPASAATGGFAVGCKCFAMLRCSGGQQCEASSRRSQGWVQCYDQIIFTVWGIGWKNAIGVGCLQGHTVSSLRTDLKHIESNTKTSGKSLNPLIPSRKGQRH